VRHLTSTRFTRAAALLVATDASGITLMSSGRRRARESAPAIAGDALERFDGHREQIVLARQAW
jgi:hypothetical protein